MFLIRCCLVWVVLSILLVRPIDCQAPDKQRAQSSDASPTFKSEVHVVVEDVVVTDHKGDPVPGLGKDDFQLLEDGKPQTVISFEEHKGVSDQAALPPLPPTIYTNYPTVKPADSINVLLLDSLNTSFSDQTKIRPQVADFLKSVPAGSHIAIFTLSSGLHMVQGFTSDSAILLDALNKNVDSRPQPSTLLPSGAAVNLDTEINDQLSVTGAGMPAGAVASAERLQEFQNRAQTSQDQLRVGQTLEALERLAAFLTGVPGRKNLIWFSQSFPLARVPGQGVQNYRIALPERLEFQKTVNMLAAAQVAIYPIAPGGLDQKFISNEARVKSVSQSSWKTVQNQQISEVTSPSWNTDNVLADQSSRDHARQVANLGTMDEIALDTGGEAFYNTNGFKDALARVVSDGAHYYTISYAPTDRRTDGSYRRIEVKLSRGDYHLSYRRGYFSEEPKQAKQEPEPKRDPLRPLMISGMPDATQITYKIRVLPLPSQTAATPLDKRAKAAVRQPLTRYAIDFAILVSDLTFTLAPDQQRQSKVEIALVAYDQAGKPVNSVVKSADISLNPQLYAGFAKTGVPLHEEIDVPNPGAYLRTGICDVATGRAGTLQVSLKDASFAQAAIK